MEDKATQPPANVNVGLYGPTAHTTPRDELNYGREKHDRTQMQVFGWNSLRWPAHNNTNGNHQVGDPGKVLFETFIIAATPHSMGNLIVIGRMNGLTN